MVEALKRKVGHSVDVEECPSFLQFTQKILFTQFFFGCFFHEHGTTNPSGTFLQKNNFIPFCKCDYLLLTYI